MDNMVVSAEFASASAAYNTWQDEVKVARQPLERQEPEVQQRWVKVAAAASAYLTHKDSASAERAPRPITNFREPVLGTSAIESTRTEE